MVKNHHRMTVFQGKKSARGTATKTKLKHYRLGKNVMYTPPTIKYWICLVRAKASLFNALPTPTPKRTVKITGQTAGEIPMWGFALP